MQAYNPGEQDRSGQIAAQNNLLYAQGISGGISQAGDGISKALQMLATRNQETKSADGTASLAHDLGIMDDMAYDHYSSLDRSSRVGAMKQLAPLIGIQQNSEYRNSLLDYKQNFLNQKNDANQGNKGMTSF